MAAILQDSDNLERAGAPTILVMQVMKPTTAAASLHHRNLEGNSITATLRHK